MPGECSNCGGVVPEPENPSQEEMRLSKSLAPFKAEVSKLNSDASKLPAPTIPVTVSQMVGIVGDSGVWEAVDDLDEVIAEISKLDLGDKGVVGKELRRLVAASIRVAERLEDAAAKIARFLPEDAGESVRDLGIEFALGGVRKAHLLIEVLADAGVSRKQELMARYEELEEQLDVDRIGVVMDSIMEVHDDLDQRISLLVGLGGSFSTDYGMLDIPAVFGAFRSFDEPLSEMAQRGRRYFGHLLENQAPADFNAWEVSLLVAGSRIAVLDSPLVGHVTASEMFSVIKRAEAANHAQTSALIQEFMDEGEVLLEGSLNLEDSLKGLFKAEADGDVEDRTYLRVILGNYQQIVETAFRECGWLAYRLLQVVDGDEPSIGSVSPEVGSLVSHLKGKSDHELARHLVSGVDVDLRNAVAHSRYKWNAESETVKDTRTKKTWEIDKVGERVQAVAGLVAGSLAGIELPFADGLLEDPDPNWPLPGESPDLTKMLARMLFKAAGATVVSVDRSGTIEVAEGEADLDVSKLVGPTLSTFNLMDGATSMAVTAPDGSSLLEVSADALQALTGLEGSVGSLAVPIPFLDHIERTGGKAEPALRDTLAIQTRLLVSMMAEDLLERDPTDPDFWPLVELQAKRIEFVTSQARQRRGASSKRNMKVISRLERLHKTVAGAVATHDPDAFRRIGHQAAGLLDWAADQEIRWPPI